MLTVFIATRNGSRTLKDVLCCFARLQSPASGWKLVVIDNASTDGTREIIQSFQTALPLTYVFEENLGKNTCLNTGLAHLEGDLAVFTDDDALPRPDWLIRIREAVDKYPDYSLFGGVILPRWEIAAPAWVEWVPVGPMFSLTDPRMKEGPIDAGSIFGPNMAVRAAVFCAGTRFDPAIGPKGPNYPMGSESELLERLKRQGHKAWHVQGAVVEHYIRKSQVDKAWILKRAIRFGRGQLRLSRAFDPAFASCRLGVPPRLFLRILRRFVTITTAWLKSDQQRLFLARWELNYLWGHVVEARISRHQRHLQA